MATKLIRVSEACDALVGKLAAEQRRTKTAVVELAVECLAGMRSEGPSPRMTLDPMHGIPEAIGTSEDFPRTWRSQEEGGYLGIARDAVPVPEKSADHSAPVAERLQRARKLVDAVAGGKTASEALGEIPVPSAPVESEAVRPDPVVVYDAAAPPPDDFSQMRGRRRG